MFYLLLLCYLRKLRFSILDRMDVCLCVQGLGVVWPTSLGRLEVNVCKVLKHQQFDRYTAFGLQVGFTPTI